MSELVVFLSGWFVCGWNSVTSCYTYIHVHVTLSWKSLCNINLWFFRTSTSGHLSTDRQTDRQSIHWLLFELLYNGHLSTTATFFCPQGGHCQWRNSTVFLLLLGLTFSPVIAKGALNHCSKVLQDLKIVGRRKFNKAHNSGKRF